MYETGNYSLIKLIEDIFPWGAYKQKDGRVGVSPFSSYICNCCREEYSKLTKKLDTSSLSRCHLDILG